jgi:hypothetical protein
LFKNSDEIQDAEMEVSIVELDTYPCWTKSMECRALRDRLEHTRKRLSLHNGPSDFLSDARRAAGALTGPEYDEIAHFLSEIMEEEGVKMDAAPVDGDVPAHGQAPAEEAEESDDDDVSCETDSNPDWTTLHTIDDFDNEAILFQYGLADVRVSKGVAISGGIVGEYNALPTRATPRAPLF